MKLGRTEQKILLILLTGVALSLTRSPKQYYRLLGQAAKEWKQISRYSLPRSVQLLEHKRLVKMVRKRDGIYVARLTAAGQEQASLWRLAQLALPPLKRWDGRWRVVMFDIPEKQKKTRNILRQCLKHWGFEELQKSVLVSPKDCRDAVELLVNANKIGKHVRFIEAKFIDRDRDLRQIFGLR